MANSRTDDALERQRADDRRAAIENTVALAEYVAAAIHREDVVGRSAIGDLPLTPGTRTWWAVRLCQDRPEVFARLLNGDFESVAAATRSAGFAPGKRRLTISRNVKGWATKLCAMLDDGELESAVKVLSEEHKARAAERTTLRDQDEMNARQNAERRIRAAARRRQVRGR